LLVAGRNATAQRRRGAPVLQPLAALASPDSEIVQRLWPAAADKGGVGGIELENRDAVDVAQQSLVERGPRAGHRPSDDRAQLLVIDADALARTLQRLAQIVDFRRLPLAACDDRVVHFGDGDVVEPFVLVGVDRLRERLGAPDAVAGEALIDAERDHLTGRAELFANSLGLADERLEHDVLLALGVDEVTTPDLLRRLELAVDAAVALFEPRRIPGQIDMDEVMATQLEIYSLARGIGADQDAQRVLGWVRIETALQFLPADDRRRAGEAGDPLVGPQVVERLCQPLFQPSAGVFVFGE